MHINRSWGFLCCVAGLLLLSACTATRGVSSKSGSTVQLREKIVDYGRQYVGVNYKPEGKRPGTGFDCSGFTSYVMAEYGIQISSSSAAQSKQGKAIGLKQARAGDLLFFGTASKIQHVALIVKREGEDLICVHATTSRGVIVENVTQSKYWKPRILYARDVISK